MITSFFVSSGQSSWSHTWLLFPPHMPFNLPMDHLNFAFKICPGFDHFSLTSIVITSVWAPSIFYLAYCNSHLNGLFLSSQVPFSLFSTWQQTWLLKILRKIMTTPVLKILPKAPHLIQREKKIKILLMVCKALHDLVILSNFISFYTFCHSLISDTLHFLISFNTPVLVFSLNLLFHLSKWFPPDICRLSLRSLFKGHLLNEDISDKC